MKTLEELRLAMDMAYLDSLYTNSGFAYYQSRYLTARDAYYDKLSIELLKEASKPKLFHEMVYNDMGY